MTVAIGHGKKAARNIDAWLRGAHYQTAAPQHELAGFDNLNTWYYSDAPATVRPQLDIARRTSTFDEVVGGLDASTALLRGAPLPVLRELLRMRQLLRLCPDNAVIKLGRGHAVRVRLRLLQGLRHLRGRMPVRGDQDGARGDLNDGQVWTGRPLAAQLR